MSNIINRDAIDEQQTLANAGVYAAIAKSMTILEDQGTDLAKKQQYEGITGIEAIHYFLMQKHNWLPSQVKSLNHEDLLFAISQDV